MAAPDVSLVVIAYNMARELPRTLLSLSPQMQRGVADIDYEVIVVDNGSDVPVDLPPKTPGVRAVRIDDAAPSPAGAVNRGIAESRADLVGVFIDGARLASPGMVRGALEGSRLHRRAVVATLGFHLGPDVQGRSVGEGYSQPTEDAMLDQSGWREDGYRLFGISAFAESSRGGWFMPIAESNALFMRRALWAELGGYDERFALPGGGLVNLDTFERATSLPDSQVVVLLGEGTFHQLHGGVATNAPVSRWPEFHADYVAIRGRDYAPPQLDPLYLGRVHPAALDKLAWSLARAQQAQGGAQQAQGDER